jgi:hypothetical protein
LAPTPRFCHEIEILPDLQAGTSQAQHPAENQNASSKSPSGFFGEASYSPIHLSKRIHCPVNLKAKSESQKDRTHRPFAKSGLTAFDNSAFPVIVLNPSTGRLSLGPDPESERHDQTQGHKLEPEFNDGQKATSKPFQGDLMILNRQNPIANRTIRSTHNLRKKTAITLKKHGS